MRTPRLPRLDSDGFSLIELMISITILGVGILSLAGLYPLATQKVTRGDKESRATFLGQAKVEELKRFPWDNLVASAGADTVEAVFVRNWAITEDDPVVGMKRVNVAVGWSDSRGPRTVVLSSFLSDSGM